MKYFEDIHCLECDVKYRISWEETEEDAEVNICAMCGEPNIKTTQEGILV